MGWKPPVLASKAQCEPEAQAAPQISRRPGRAGSKAANRAKEPAQPTGLQEALAEHKIIFDNAIVGICYTQERVIVRCNRRFEEMFDYGSGELDNRNVRLLYPSSESFLKIGQSGYQYLLTHHSYSDERIMRRKDGTLFWCNVAGKTLDPENPPRGAIWIFQDISKRKSAEEALQRAHERLELEVQERTAELRKANETLRAEVERRQVVEEALIASREKYRVLFETFPIGLSITDEQGNVIEINRSLSRLTSQATQAALIRELKVPGATVIRADGSPLTREELPSFRALMEQRAIHDIELGVRYANGKLRWFSVTAAPIAVKGYGAVIAHTEITERRRSEEQERQQRIDLAHVSRLNTMGEMAAALAHELGQPLSSTLNYLHGCQLRLEDGHYDKELLRSALSQAIHHAEQAGGIVTHMRQFVRRHEPETIPTDINAVIREMVAFLDFDLRECRTALRLSLAEGLPLLLLDPLEIKQVIVNLIKNGVDSMAELAQPQRQLDICTRPSGSRWIEIEVADRGAGIARKDASRIFDAFFTTKRNGLGLGLAICRTIVESHGGRITVSRNVYGGASFGFRLPIGVNKA
jgi:PAS domain S-box-containing protein